LVEGNFYLIGSNKVITIEASPEREGYPLFSVMVFPPSGPLPACQEIRDSSPKFYRESGPELGPDSWIRASENPVKCPDFPLEIKPALLAQIGKIRD